MKKRNNPVLDRAVSAMLLILAATACAEKHSSPLESNVPRDWYSLPEDRPASQADADLHEPAERAKLDRLRNTVDTVINTNTEALNAGMPSSGNTAPALSPPPPQGFPKDWVPWHAEIFTTDLTLSAGGLLGSLIMKGAATVRAFWRKQGTPPTSPYQTSAADASSEVPTILFRDDPDPRRSMAEIADQLDPAIRAAAATGKIKDTPELREQLMSAGREFQAVSLAIPSTESALPWWVSRFRLDLTVDVSGKVVPVGSVGGEVQFRFEWHRIMHTHSKPKALSPSTAQAMALRSGLEEFITATSHDIEAAFGDLAASGFQAHTMRIGIGVSAKGKIGIVKGSAGIVGQIYFTRDVKRPVVWPRTLQVAAHDSPLFIIERNPAPEHLHFARENLIPFEASSLAGKNPGGARSAIEEVVYQIDRSAFRKGLKKAASIAEFFAESAAKGRSGAWKVYELRTGFDTSLSGDLDLVTLTGSATAQISFFNRSF